MAILLQILLVFLFSCQTQNKDAENNQLASNKSQDTPAIITTTEQPGGIEEDFLAHLKPEHKKVLQKWLKGISELRPATEKYDSFVFNEKYKSYLEENTKLLRENTGMSGNQYYAVGDMNKDGKVDFAVLLVDKKVKDGEQDKFALAIFNAPFSKAAPAYLEKGLIGISNSYITFNRVIRGRLYLGKFESDVYCATYYPRKGTYYFKDCM